MAKILVADDNSNIQKMVGLALKDQGIDVVAVGNGEAAVRKISDVRPDLVLADVFMPVRNGYEVCKYVKDDSKLSHIPVILLVGAFDPLDEQEAQRVGADGVLKKPFVPPDPLISMVKSALARAGISYSGENADKSAQPAALKAADLLTPRVPPPPPPTPVIEEPVPMIDSAPLPEPEEISTRPAPIKIDAGASAPVAFGNLLEPAQAEEDDTYITPVSSSIAPERNWGSSSDDSNDRFGRSKSSWRRDGAEEEEFEDTSATGAIRDWRETLEASAGRGGQVNEWEASKESPAFTEAAFATPEAAKETTAAVAESSVAETHVEPAAISSSVISGTVDASANGIAANGIAVSSETESILEEKPASTEIILTESPVEVIQESASVEKSENTEAPVKSDAVQTETLAIEPEKAEPEKKSVANTWFTPAPNPWDAEMQKSAQLASTWDTPAIPTAKFASADDRQSLNTQLEITSRQAAEPETAKSETIIELSETAERDAAKSSVADGAITQETIAQKEHEHEEVVAAKAKESYAVIEKEEAAPVAQTVPLSATTSFAHDLDATTTLSAAEVETLREEAPQATNVAHDEIVHTSSVSSVSSEAKTESTAATAPNGAEKPAVTTTDMDEVVAKVLAKMSPEVLQAVTREILKPVVEAIVRDELNKKS